MGGGPAGSVLATRLARLGYQVCLLDRRDDREGNGSNGEAPISVGETLSPSVPLLLSHAGVDLDWSPPMALPTTGHLVCWGTREMVRVPFTPEGRVRAYQVDRSAFDRALRQKASQTGVVVFGGATLQEFRRVSGDSWQVTFSTSTHGQRRVSGRWIADATGRRRRLGGRLTTYRTCPPRLVGVVGYWRSRGSEGQGDFMIEALENGWLSFAPLPRGQANLTFMTGPEALRTRGTKSLLEFYLQSISSSHYIRATVSSFTPPSQVGVFDATPRIAASSIGPGWILVGDASSELDPLSGQGVQKAIGSALAASVVVHTSFARPSHTEAAFRFYQEREQGVFATHLQALHRQYAQETRWAEQAFWKARAGPSEGSAAGKSPSDFRGGEPAPLHPYDRIRPGRGIRVVHRPVLEGEFIEVREVVVVPGNVRGVRYWGTICVPELLDLLGDSPTVMEGVQRFLLRTDPSLNPGYVYGALHRLLSLGIVERL